MYLFATSRLVNICQLILKNHKAKKIVIYIDEQASTTWLKPHAAVYFSVNRVESFLL